ncbi:MAG: ABC transporter permease [Bacteroidales bacterium]|nr:ABC transporter permease [Bacteroidales bacterium]
MKFYFILAWRNIWRNKRRTLITTASVFFGVLLSAFMSSMQEGSYDQYIRAIVNSYSGHIQIHRKGYWNDKIINNSFLNDGNIDSLLHRFPEVTIYSPRFETFCLASSEDVTKGVMILGIEPLAEDKITNISVKLYQGEYLKKGDNGVILGSRLAQFMKIGPGDTLVLIGQGYHGSGAAGKYPVRGIIKHPSPELDRTLVCMELQHCQELFSAPDLLTSMVIMVNDNEKTLPIKMALTESLGDDLEVIDWMQMNQLLLKQIDSDRAQGVITKGILYMIIAFGILGTVIMMVAERTKEFGVILAVGMKKRKLITIIILETIFMGMTGVITGVAASIPLLYYFLYNPIPFTGQAAEMMLQMGFEPAMYFSMAPSVFYEQALTIFIFTLVIGIYPIFNIRKLQIMKALRS